MLQKEKAWFAEIHLVSVSMKWGYMSHICYHNVSRAFFSSHEENISSPHMLFTNMHAYTSIYTDMHKFLMVCFFVF